MTASNSVTVARASGAGSSTICAPATATGGAIAIIRISGPDAIAIADRIFHGRTKLSEAKTHTTHYGEIISVPCGSIAGKPLVQGASATVAHASGVSQPIDESLATIFRAPHSYTGEDSVELSCHGSQYILQQVLALLCENGCRMAEPGEFTQRAFLNGKMDLAQAESVADLIASRSHAQHSMAMSQLRGTFSRHIDDLHDCLLHLTTLMELELDFSDHEELEFADRSELNTLTDEIIDTVTRLADSFATGNAIKEGVRVAIVGPTNAGKSTLLNAILHEERAIVSDIHGTTRDTIEDTFTWQGITFRFIDTAGLRDTTDTIEQIGINRTRQAIRDAHIVLYLSDNLNDLEQEHLFPTALSSNKATIIRVLTKTDQHAQDNSQFSILNSQLNHVLPISAKTGFGLDTLQQRVCDIARNVLHLDAPGLIVSNQRHHAALCAALPPLQRVRIALRDNLPTDFITQDLRDALHHLATITHREITPDTVLQNVFQNFCVGK